MSSGYNRGPVRPSSPINESDDANLQYKPVDVTYPSNPPCAINAMPRAKPPGIELRFSSPRSHMTLQFSSCCFWLLLLRRSRFIWAFDPPRFSSSRRSCALGNLYAAIVSRVRYFAVRVGSERTSCSAIPPLRLLEALGTTYAHLGEVAHCEQRLW